MNRVEHSPEAGAARAGLAHGLNSQSAKPGVLRGVRVLLADDHPVVRWGLTCCLASREDLVVVGEAADGLEAVRKAKELSPDVVLMDIDMPQLNGLSATEILRRENPAIKVILLSMHSYTMHVPRILQSGARGFLPKNARPDDIVAAIVAVASGGTCFGPEIAQQALGHFAHSLQSGLEGKTLSPRERDVLIGIAEGLSNKQLANRLGISARTVETHRGHIMQKLSIRSVAGLTRFAVTEGLVVLDKDETSKD